MKCVRIMLVITIMVTLGCGGVREETPKQSAGEIEIKVPSTGGIKAAAEPEIISTDGRLVDSNGLTIHLHSSGELLITDSLGRRTGLDPSIGQTFNEIPNASYDRIGLDDLSDPDNPIPDEHPTKELELVRPLEGEYALRIAGTVNETYKLLIYPRDAEGTPSQIIFRDVPIALGEVHTYTIKHHKVSGSETSVTRLSDSFPSTVIIPELVPE